MGRKQWGEARRDLEGSLRFLSPNPAHPEWFGLFFFIFICTPFCFIIVAKLYITASQEIRRPCWMRYEGCKQVKARSDREGWLLRAISGSEAVDGWPCGNLPHQPPSPRLCVRLHKRIHRSSRPVAGRWKTRGAQLRLRQPVCGSVLSRCLFKESVCGVSFLRRRLIFRWCCLIILKLDGICHHGNHRI